MATGMAIIMDIGTDFGLDIIMDFMGQNIFTIILLMCTLDVYKRQLLQLPFQFMVH